MGWREIWVWKKLILKITTEPNKSEDLIGFIQRLTDRAASHLAYRKELQGPDTMEARRGRYSSKERIVSGPVTFPRGSAGVYGADDLLASTRTWGLTGWRRVPGRGRRCHQVGTKPWFANVGLSAVTPFSACCFFFLNACLFLGSGI